MLRASDRKYQKCDDRSEISNFIFFYLKYNYDELLSKIMFKGPVAFLFFQKIGKSKTTLNARKNRGKSCTFIKLVHNNENDSQFSFLSINFLNFLSVLTSKYHLVVHIFGVLIGPVKISTFENAFSKKNLVEFHRSTFFLVYVFGNKNLLEM